MCRLPAGRLTVEIFLAEGSDCPHDHLLVIVLRKLDIPVKLLHPCVPCDLRLGWQRPEDREDEISPVGRRHVPARLDVKIFSLPILQLNTLRGAGENINLQNDRRQRLLVEGCPLTRRCADKRVKRFDSRSGIPERTVREVELRRYCRRSSHR